MSKVFVVDDDAAVRDGLTALLETAELEVECYSSASAFLAAYKPNASECLLLDLHMPGMSGLELQAELERRGIHVPIVFLTAHGDIPTTVRAIKGGALDFLTKPVRASKLLERVQVAIRTSETSHNAAEATREGRERLASLSEREREVMVLAIAGKHNKDIARQLGISHRTMEVHRANILRKTGVASLLELAHLVETLHT